MRRMRTRWVLGSALLLGGVAASCGGNADGLFTQPSSNAGHAALDTGGASHAGADAGQGGAAGAVNHPAGGASTTSDAGGGQGGAIGHAGAGGIHVAGGGAGGAVAGGGATAGEAGSHAGSAGSHAGSAGSHAGSGGAGGSSAGAGGSSAGAGGFMAGAGGVTAGAGGATGGAAGSSAGAGGSVAGAAGSSAGAGNAATCVDNTDCLPSEYCDKSSCDANAEGHCLPTPTDCEGTKLAVVCGCNGVTYHDACLLHHARTNSDSQSSGACSKTAPGTVTCASNFSQMCAGLGGVCGFKVDNDCVGAQSMVLGTCWVLPASCPGSDAKTARPCDDMSCISECDAIQQSLHYAVPDHCN